MEERVDARKIAKEEEDEMESPMKARKKGKARKRLLEAVEATDVSPPQSKKVDTSRLGRLPDHIIEGIAKIFSEGTD